MSGVHQLAPGTTRNGVLAEVLMADEIFYSVCFLLGYISATSHPTALPGIAALAKIGLSKPRTPGRTTCFQHHVWRTMDPASCALWHLLCQPKWGLGHFRKENTCNGFVLSAETLGNVDNNKNIESKTELYGSVKLKKMRKETLPIRHITFKVLVVHVLARMKHLLAFRIDVLRHMSTCPIIGVILSNVVFSMANEGKQSRLGSTDASHFRKLSLTMIEDATLLEVPCVKTVRRRKQKKYRKMHCVCGSIKVKTAAFWVAVLTLLITVFDFLHTVRITIHDNNVKGFWVAFSILLDITWFLSSLCAFESVVNEDPDFLYPFLIMNVVVLVVIPTIFIISFLMLLFPHTWFTGLFFDRRDTRPEAMDACFYRMLISFFLIPITMCFTYIVRQCYNNFREFRKKRRSRRG
uniref:G_PROTEIN_RECEP_F1_2 domain-containing protein n=1 Tax=Steinernema glaseri TaxID=37863 RepID=A0A1I7YG38_9BILA